jgi:hypothetical protein
MTVRRPPHRVGGALSSLGLVGLLGTAGCAGFAGAAPDPAPTTSTAPTTSAAPVATTAAAPAFQLPATCADLLTVSEVNEALGVRLPGTSTYLLGQAEPGVGRTGRVTCGYGVTPATGTAGASDPLLQVTVATYTDTASAAVRLELAAESGRAAGAVVEDAVVPGTDAVLVAGPADTTLVAVVAARTYVVTLVPGLLDAPGTRTALTALAVAAAGPAADPAAGTTTSPPTGRPAGTSTSAPTG